MVWVRELTCYVELEAGCQCCNFYSNYLGVRWPLPTVVEVWNCGET